MPDERTPVPQSRTVPRKHTRFSLVWVIPIVALAVGVWVGISRLRSEGPVITITFNNAEGLEAGKTRIVYKGVNIGTITTIRLSEDHERVIAKAQMMSRTEDFLVEDTKFWVVKPRISGANITGLGTLISGSYIGVEIGFSKMDRRDFVGRETPPIVTGDVPGRFFTLKTSNLGSLDTGTPVFFRHLQVGEIASYKLDKDGRMFTVRIFVKMPYDQYVNPNTRFWQASGVDLQLTAGGLKVQTESILSILIGGVAFETPADSKVLPPADADTLFTLYNNRSEAYEPPPRYPQTYQLVFKDSVEGLLPGAPVEFRGIRIGEVKDVHAEIDMKTLEFSIPVIVEVDPQRLGVQVVGQTSPAQLALARRRLIDSLVAHGVRAQLRTGNLLTGATLVALDVFPNAKPATVNWSQNPAQLPTVRGTLSSAETKLQEIINKINQMPLTEIGDELKNALGQLNLTLVSARGTLTTADNFISPESPQAQQLSQTMIEISRAARSLRVLADFLEQHPEALIRGKEGEPKK